MDIDHLSEVRKPDRAKIAQLVADLCDEFRFDYKWTREGFDECYPKAQVIQIHAPRGLLVGIELDGDSCQHNVHVLPWHMSSDVDTCLSDRFGSINNYHFRKATQVSYGTAALLQGLRERFMMIKDGSAFDGEREKASIIKHGTAAERNAAWAEARKEWAKEKADA